MITFNNITLEGFGSCIKPIKFKLDREGLNILIAEVGSGKTTIFSGLYWAISGKALKPTKSVTTWPHLQTKGFQGTKVNVQFTKDSGDIYEIIRCKDYKGKVEGVKGASKLFILKNGKSLDITGKKLDVQKTLYDIIGYNDDLFINTIIFGQRMKRIIESSGPEKKKLFEEAFELSFVRDAKSKADEDLVNAVEDLDEVSHKYELLQTKFDGDKQLYAHVKAGQKIFLENQQTEILNLEDEIQSLGLGLGNEKELKMELKAIEIALESANSRKAKMNAKDSPNKVRYTIRDLEAGLVQKESRLKTLEQRVKDIKATPTKECPNCGGELKGAKLRESMKYTLDMLNEIGEDKAYTKAEIKEANKSLSEYKKKLAEIENVETNLEVIDQEINKHTRRKATLTNQLNDITQIKYRIEALEKELKKVQKEEPPKYPKGLKKRLKDTQEKLNKQSELYKKLTKKVANLKWLTGDLLGNKGIKSYIFDTMLENLNDRLKYYEQFIGWRVEFKVDLESSNKDIYAICHTGENLVFYEDLSGGQKQMVDAATAFAIHDLISEGRPVNLLVFDEPFESLDETHADVIMDLIKDKSEGKSVYLISHNLILQNISTKVIRMKLDNNGQSQLKLL